jgi:pheromone shutdown protein TraB
VLDEINVAFHNDWLEVVNNSLPGLFSSFAIHNHTQPTTKDSSNIRAELDIRDFRDASLGRDLLMIRTIAMMALQGNPTIPEQLRYFVLEERVA